MGDLLTEARAALAEVEALIPASYVAALPAHHLRAALAAHDTVAAELAKMREWDEHAAAAVKMDAADFRQVVKERDEVAAERDRLRDILRCERGEWAPDGWVWRPAERAWQSAINLVMLHDGGWGWCFRKGTGRRGQGTAPTALEAIEAADKAARGKA